METYKKILIVVLVLSIILGGFSIYKVGKNKDNKIVKYNITSSGSTTSNSGIIDNKINENGVLAYINEYEGTVKKNNLTVSNSDTIASNDIIETGDDGEAEIIFTDNSIVRLNNNTTLTFSRIDNNSSEIELNSGEIWARILKPITDSSFFTIKTADISAGVRGTSVIMKKLGENTQVSVVDSYAENENDKGIELKYRDNTTKKEIIKHLKPEEQLLLDKKTNTIRQEFIKKIELLKNDFVLNNTKKDLVYMDKMLDISKNNKNLLKKIKGEMSESMPKKDEIQVFFKEEKIKNKMEEIMKNKNVNLGGVLGNIKKDLEITKLRNKNIKDRKNLDLLSLEKREQLMEEIEKRELMIKEKLEEFLLENKTFTGQTLEIPKIINDKDKDGIADERDNCPSVSNPFQKDSNSNGVGDACEIIKTPEPIIQEKIIEIKDMDKDGIADERDNCPSVSNPFQKDSNSNGIGDACEIIKTPEPLPIISGEAQISN